MEERITPVVHYFDTDEHRILCGVRGVEHRSTKHPRGVSCEACVELMTERSESGEHGRRGIDTAAHAHQPT